MPTITTAITNPQGTSVTTGTLEFVADKTSGTVLKWTKATVTPGTSIVLLANTYKVYYTDSDDQKFYVGEITVASSDASLVSLL